MLVLKQVVKYESTNLICIQMRRQSQRPLVLSELLAYLEQRQNPVVWLCLGRRMVWSHELYCVEWHSVFERTVANYCLQTFACKTFSVAQKGLPRYPSTLLLPLPLTL